VRSARTNAEGWLLYVARSELRLTLRQEDGSSMKRTTLLWLAGAGLILAALLVVPFGGDPTSGQGTVGTIMPNADKSNGGSWTNEGSNTCFDSASCYQSLDEGIASANDADFISSVPDPMARLVEFEMEDAPVDLDTLLTSR
jgi:hypothetical protein